MTVKRISLLLASLAVLAAGVAFADHHGEGRGHSGARGMPGGFPMMMVGRLTRHLDLDENQEVQVNNILDAVKPEFEAIKERGRSNRDAMLSLNPADADYSAALNNLALESGQIVTDSVLLMGRVRVEVNAVLTPEQIAELEATIERFGERRSERRGRRPREE